jgi:thiamine biosynthesis protein ThiS
MPSPPSSIRIVLNGEPHHLSSPGSVRSLLEELGLDPDRVAVEVNRRILKRAQFGSREVSEGDEVEVVTFVGGG